MKLPIKVPPPAPLLIHLHADKRGAKPTVTVSNLLAKKLRRK